MESWEKAVNSSMKEKSRNKIMNYGFTCARMLGSVILQRHMDPCFFWLIEPLKRLIPWRELEEIICARDNVESDDKHSLVFPGLHLNSPCQLWNCGTPQYIIVLHSFVFIIASKRIWSCSGHFPLYGGLENKCDSGVTLGLCKQRGICSLIKGKTHILMLLPKESTNHWTSEWKSLQCSLVLS